MTIKERFEELMTQWYDETCYLSNPSAICNNGAHNGILAMGWLAVPLLLETLARPGGSYAYDILEHITKQWPPRPEDAGKVRVMCDAWIKWGKERSVLISLLSGLRNLCTAREPFALVEFYPPSASYEYGVFTIDSYLGSGQELYIEGDEYGYLDACVGETVEQHDHVEGVTDVEDFLSALKELSNG